MLIAKATDYNCEDIQNLNREIELMKLGVKAISQNYENMNAMHYE